MIKTSCAGISSWRLEEGGALVCRAGLYNERRRWR
jgi:hypothetical protein